MSNGRAPGCKQIYQRTVASMADPDEVADRMLRRMERVNIAHDTSLRFSSGIVKRETQT